MDAGWCDIPGLESLTYDRIMDANDVLDAIDDARSRERVEERA